MNTIDEYLAAQPDPHRGVLTALRTLINDEAPQATEAISWGMPTWKLNGNLIHIAAAKHHVGVHPGADGVAHVADELDRLGLTRSKGTFRLPLDAPLPEEMLRRLVRFRVQAQEAGPSSTA